jgi:hypothetical protein
MKWALKHNKELFTLPNDSFTFLDVELNDKQLMKYRYSIQLMFLPWTEIQEIE